VRKFLTDALLIAAISVVGYVLAYSFETGFARQLGYHKYLIELSTANMAYALTITAVGAAAVLQLFWVYRTTKVGAAPRSFWTLAGIGLGILALQVVLASKVFPQMLIIFVMGSLVIGRKLYLRRYDPLSTDPVVRRTMTGVLVVVLIANAFFGARALGSWQARTQQNFYALHDDPTMLVVRAYGPNFVAVRFDPVKRQFTNELRVFRLEDKVPMNMLRIVIDQRSVKRVSTLGTAYD
jgi:hypothetical protein